MFTLYLCNIYAGLKNNRLYTLRKTKNNIRNLVMMIPQKTMWTEGVVIKKTTTTNTVNHSILQKVSYSTTLKGFDGLP